MPDLRHFLPFPHSDHPRGGVFGAVVQLQRLRRPRRAKNQCCWQLSAHRQGRLGDIPRPVAGAVDAVADVVGEEGQRVRTAATVQRGLRQSVLSFLSELNNPKFSVMVEKLTFLKNTIFILGIFNIFGTSIIVSQSQTLLPPIDNIYSNIWLNTQLNILL